MEEQTWSKWASLVNNCSKINVQLQLTYNILSTSLQTRTSSTGSKWWLQRYCVAKRQQRRHNDNRATRSVRVVSARCDQPTSLAYLVAHLDFQFMRNITWQKAGNRQWAIGKWQANRKTGATNHLDGCPTRCLVHEEYDLAKVTTYPFALDYCVTF